MNDFDYGNRSTRRKAWAYIVSLLGVSGIVEVGWIGQITLLDTIFNWGKIQAYLQSNNQGFVIAALVGIYLEIVKPNTISEIFRARLDTLDEILRRLSNIDGVDSSWNANTGVLQQRMIWHKQSYQISQHLTKVT